MTLVLTDKPLEDFYLHYLSKFDGIPEEITFVKHGCLMFRRERIYDGCAKEGLFRKEWHFGDEFKEMYCYSS